LTATASSVFLYVGRLSHDYFVDYYPHGKSMEQF
jgi:hypothetical protein